MVVAPNTSPLRARLREYQCASVDFLVKHCRGRGIDASEVGTGKTPCALVAADELVGTDDVLVICPKIAVGVWQDHIRDWLGREAVVYTGTPAERQTLSLRGTWYIVSYALAGEIQSRRAAWSLIIADEAHQLKNRQAKTRWQVVRRFKSDYFLLLTGTPTVNDGGDLWTLLNLVSPRDFPGYWQYVQKHFKTYRNIWNGVEVDKPRDAKAYEQMLAKHLIRHEVRDVIKELPPKIRQQLPVQMTPAQARIYRQIAKEMMAELGDGEILLVPNTIVRLTRLRQVLVTPALVGGPNTSGVLDALKDALDNEFEAGRSSIVFTPFAQALPYLKEIVQKAGAWCGVIQGGMSGEATAKVVRDFQQHGDPKKVILATIQCASSWTATAAATMFFVGIDWSLVNHIQAEGRAYRFGQKSVVHANYFVHRGTIDTHALRLLNNKEDWQALVSRVGLRGLLLPQGA